MDLLKSITPLLGNALLGPLGGAAASFIADKLGIEGKTIEAVNEILNSGKMTPDQIGKLKLAEVDFKKFLESNKIKLEELEVADRGSAREMQKAVKSSVPAALTFLITIGFFGVLAWMLADSKVVNSPPILIMLGSLGTAWTACVSYWFGTTKGSSDKNAYLSQAK